MYNNSVDFEEAPITEAEVISILGSNYKVQGDELVWRCMACPNGDKKGDNLKFNRVKHCLHCFACDYAEEVVGIIARRRHERALGEQNVPQAPYAPQRREQAEESEPVVKEKGILLENLVEYYFACHNRLMTRKDILKQMYQKHTIMPKTAATCMIGYDDKRDKLVFPSWGQDKDPTDNLDKTENGAEYREYKGEKNFSRISGYDAKICRIAGGAFTTFGIICEGYKDAYNLYQLLMMTDPARLNCTSIFTLQNGTNSVNTNNCLQKVNWNKFEEIGLLMDDDVAGSKATEIAQGLFPRMTDLRSVYLKGHNDIQARFKAEYAELIDIDKALSAEWLKEYK